MEGKKIKETQEVYTVQCPSLEKKADHEKKSFWSIDKQMIRYKYHFFLYIGANGAVLPYIPIIARNRIGLTATSLAAILTAQQFITILSKPIIGYIVDYFNKLKLMIILLIIIQTTFFWLLLAVPPISSQQSELSQTQVDFHPGNISNHEEMIIIFRKKIYDNCERHFEQDLSQTKSVEEDNLVTADRRNLDDIICIGSYNKTALYCYQNEAGKDYKKGLHHNKEPEFCCFTYHQYEGVPLNFSETIDSIRVYTLSSMQTSLLQSNLNTTFPCSLEFHERDFSSNPQASNNIKDFQTLEFWLFAFIYSIAATCVNSAFTLGDTACCESIQKCGGDFGRQRLFGAVGWGTIASISGLLCDLTNDYITAWVVNALLMTLAIWNITKMDMLKPHFSQNILRDIGTVLRSLQFLTFEVGIFMCGMGAGIVWFYQIWFLTSLGCSKFLCGLVQYVQCFIGEIPFMFYSGFFINKMGHFNLISAALICYAFRFMWYGYLQNPWLVLPIEIMHSFTYGTYYPTLASFGRESAKPGTEATTQSILFSTHEGLGAGLGCVLAGIGFDHLGGHKTFFYTGIFCFCATLVNVFNTFLNKKRRKNLAISQISLKN